MKKYMIDGFEIECGDPAPWELALTWAHGRETLWPARTRQEALAAQEKISLRPTLMARIEVRSGTYTEVLWDSSWPRENYGDLTALPEDISGHFTDTLLNLI